jgi:hypothetical protein
MNELPADFAAILAKAEEAGAVARDAVIRANGDDAATATIKHLLNEWAWAQVATLTAAAAEVGLDEDDTRKAVGLYLDAVHRGITGEAEAGATRH